MSRCGYVDDLDQWTIIKYRGQVASAARGKRGQTFLRALLASLDAMHDKRLIANDLRDASGDVCALGSLGRARGLPLETLDAREHEQLGQVFDIAPQLIAEIEYENDRDRTETPARRWERMRRIVASLIKPDAVIP